MPMVLKRYFGDNALVMGHALSLSLHLFLDPFAVMSHSAIHSRILSLTKTQIKKESFFGK